MCLIECPECGCKSRLPHQSVSNKSQASPEDYAVIRVDCGQEVINLMGTVKGPNEISCSDNTLNLVYTLTIRTPRQIV